jgi:hypothetical protein
MIPSLSSVTAIDPIEKYDETIYFFDWDDTLLTSTFLFENYRWNNPDPPSKEIAEGLKALDENVSSLLSSALTYGSVYIVTNAELSWVYLSSNKYLPKVTNLLSKVNIISARDRYRATEESHVQWKFKTFKDILDINLTNKIKTNVISMGDSLVEREAIRNLTQDVSHITCKSIKFEEFPSLIKLNQQIKLIITCMSYIAESNQSLDLQLNLPTEEGKDEETENLNEEVKND